MRRKKIIKHYFEYLFLVFFTFIIRIFPLKINLFFASNFGRILFYINKKHRIVALDNLKNAFPEKNDTELIRILKKVYINLSKTGVEFLSLPVLGKRYFKDNIIIKGRDNLDKALKLNKGIVAITSHLGNWELLSAIMMKNGYHSAAIYHPLKNPLSDRFINRIREKTGMKLISFRKAFLPSVRYLKQNHLLGLIADQDAGKDGVFINFFNRLASTAKGPAIFAVKTRAPVILFTLIRENNDHHTLHISKPFDIKITDNMKKDIYYNTKLWSDELEKWVRKYPEQWFWVHRRWYSRPKKPEK